MPTKPLLLALWVAASLPAAGPVHVEIFEDLTPHQLLQLPSATPVDTYSEPAFAFPHTPTKFTPTAAPADRSTPFYLRATYQRAFPAGPYQFRLRARGAARLSIDGKLVASTKPQKPNTSSDDPVPQPVERGNTPLRPAAYPHQDQTVTLHLSPGPHSFELVAAVGGKGLYPSTGELAVSVARPGELDRLLGPDNAPLLTDAAWESYVADSFARHTTADRDRRRAAGRPVAAAWNQRHLALRNRLTPPSPGASIDGFLDAKLRAASVPPAPPLADLAFLRRVTLDTTGLIPTPAQVQAFLRDQPATRRANAIERLLQDPSWADHWVAYWQDVLAENPGILKPDLNNTGPFRWWMHNAFSDNIPFDRFVAELVQMDGSPTLGGPASFGLATLNDAPMAAKADIIGQAFLGQKLSCARCHDAPFHPYKQQDLFAVAAMLNGGAVKLPVTSTVPQGEGGRRPNVVSALKPGETIAPAWPFAKLAAHAATGDLPPSNSPETRRELAAYLVAPENERFAQVIANRVWRRYMGVGIFEPVDDWARGRASHPELLAYLGQQFAYSGYDLKHLARLILNSRAYQRQAVGTPADQLNSAKRLFAGPAHRNLTAEELVDSLHLAAGKTFDCEPMNLNPAGDRTAKQFLDLGSPTRAWMMTALSNERDRPALALPIAQSIVDVMTTYGWRQSRQSPATDRDDAPSPMQTLILANGVLGTRMARLSDDSWFTARALSAPRPQTLIDETFLRILSRPPRDAERARFASLLTPVFANRIVAGAPVRASRRETDGRVSWSNHLSAEASLIRMEEERKLRFGDQPTARLTKDFRERYEDMLWALMNSPEFAMVP